MLACVVALAACATGSPGTTPSCSSPLVRDTVPLHGDIDSTSLVADVSAAWTPVDGLVLASVWYDSVGVLDTVQVLSTSLAEADRSRMRAAVNRNVPPRAEAEAVVRLVLGDRTGPTVRRVSAFKGCAPVLLHRDWLAVQLQTEGQVLRPWKRLTVMVMLRVREDGRVTEARVDESSGNPAADAAALRILTRATFTPAMIEGIPVEVWTRFPVSLSPA